MGDAQLRELAKSMGIKHVDSFDYDGLVFQVLDHQAETEAANAPEPTRRRRERIRQPAAKANGNEVIKDDAVAPKNQNKEQINIIDNTEADSKPTDVVVQEAKAEPKEQTKAQKKTKAKDKDLDKNEVQEPPKRKRGRPSAAEKAARDLLLKNEPVEQTATTEEALQQEQTDKEVAATNQNKSLTNNPFCRLKILRHNLNSKNRNSLLMSRWLSLSKK